MDNAPTNHMRIGTLVMDPEDFIIQLGPVQKLV
jgi:hypothetical protein